MERKRSRGMTNSRIRKTMGAAKVRRRIRKKENKERKREKKDDENYNDDDKED